MVLAIESEYRKKKEGILSEKKYYKDTSSIYVKENIQLGTNEERRSV